jgi:thiamine pyrophosphate-dependent acetolactate synthase large subunit-like protein
MWENGFWEFYRPDSGRALGGRDFSWSAALTIDLLHNPEFAAFAELCGAKGIRVTALEELDGAIAGALAYDGPALVEVVTDALLI